MTARPRLRGSTFSVCTTPPPRSVSLCSRCGCACGGVGWTEERSGSETAGSEARLRSSFVRSGPAIGPFSAASLSAKPSPQSRSSQLSLFCCVHHNRLGHTNSPTHTHTHTPPLCFDLFHHKFRPPSHLPVSLFSACSSCLLL